MSQVTEVMGQVHNSLGDLTGMSDEMVTSLTTGALDISKTFGKDTTEVIGAAGQMIRNGLAPDAKTALDMITAGFTSGTDRAGDMLDSLNEYAEPFASIGLDGSQALGMLNAGLDAGAFNADKVGDAIKEFAIRAVDGSKASGEAYAALGLNADEMARKIAEGGPAATEATSEIIRALSGMEDKVAQDAAGVALFGSTWEDLGPQVIGSLDPLAASLGDVTGATDTLSDTLNDNLGTRIETLKRKGLDGLAKIAEKVVIPALEAIMPHAERLGVWLGEEVPKAVEAMRPHVERVVAIVQQHLPTAIAMASAAFERIQPVIAKLVILFTSGFEAVRATVERVVKIVSWIWQTFGDTLLSHFSKKLSAIVTVLSGVFEVVTGLFDFISALMQGKWGEAWDAILKILGGLGTVLVGLLQALWATIGTVFLLAKDAIVAIVGALVGAVVSWLAGLGGRALGALAGIGSTLVGKGRELIGGLSEGAVSAFVAVRDWFAGLPQRAADAIGNVGSKLKETGKSLVQGIIEGIATMGSAVSNAVKGLIPSAGDVKGWVGGLFGRFSGGPISAGGMYRVGERGPETVYLPKGSSVTPNHAGGGGGSGNVVNVYASTNANPYDVAREVSWALRTSGR